MNIKQERPKPTSSEERKKIESPNNNHAPIPFIINNNAIRNTKKDPEPEPNDHNRNFKFKTRREVQDLIHNMRHTK